MGIGPVNIKVDLWGAELYSSGWWLGLVVVFVNLVMDLEVTQRKRIVNLPTDYLLLHRTPLHAVTWISFVGFVTYFAKRDNTI